MVDYRSTTSKMEIITVPESEDSENSIVEVEVPRKPTPPLIVVEEDEMILNVQERNKQSILASDIIRNDLMLADKLRNTQLGVKNDQCLSNPRHWTVDMIKFYNDDWGGEEDFIVEKIQEKMNKSPSLWQISRKDYLYPKYKDQRRDVKCSNCHYYGHKISDCPEPYYVPKCFMCGNKGHYSNLCPESKCLTCGNRSNKYLISCYKCQNKLDHKCSRCHMLGHHFIDCSDHWRLYHLTTKSMSVVVPDGNVYKSKKDLWCCNCGNQGHHYTMCLHVKKVQYTDTLPYVVSYKKAFEYKQFRKIFSGNPKKKLKKKRKQSWKEKFKTNSAQWIRSTKERNYKMHNSNFKMPQKYKRLDRNKWS